MSNLLQENKPPDFPEIFEERYYISRFAESTLTWVQAVGNAESEEVCMYKLRHYIAKHPEFEDSIFVLAKQTVKTVPIGRLRTNVTIEKTDLW